MSMTGRFTATGTLVESDHRTAWVTLPTGITIGRWSPVRMDVHTRDSVGCLDCGEGTWEEFVEAMDRHHGVKLCEEDRPRGCHART